MLLDTHVVLWLIEDHHRLGAETRAALAGGSPVHVSAASLWELAIKAETGKLDVPDDLPELVAAAGLVWLPITAEHVWTVRQPSGLTHRDPFDALLVAQARVEAAELVTADQAILAAAPDGVRLRDARN
ncbi:MAG: type II toxin-antitoxin system VapC family toxin [Nocardioides sp.]